MKSVSRAGVKLWVPSSIVKFGCLVHDVQLSSSARRICRIVTLSSIETAMFAMPVSLQMVLLISPSSRLRVDERRPLETQTSFLSSMLQSVGVAGAAGVANLADGGTNALNRLKQEISSRCILTLPMS